MFTCCIFIQIKEIFIFILIFCRVEESLPEEESYMDEEDERIIEVEEDEAVASVAADVDKVVSEVNIVVDQAETKPATTDQEIASIDEIEIEEEIIDKVGSLIYV